MLRVSMSGVCSIVAAGWFIIDFSTMGVTYMMNGEAKSMGDLIDEGLDVNVKLYEGIY